ncbi:FMN-linked oxidoreductases superfamily protein [Wolffia australiana]
METQVVVLPGQEGDGVAPKSMPEDLVARAIAPVKADYLRPSRSKSISDAADQNGGNTVPLVVSEKKSKRQLKRERNQERNSAKSLCSAVAKSGDPGACRFGENCRFSHDLEGFLQQKPEDLPGICPFMACGRPCPYGVACRLHRSHREFILSVTSNELPKIHDDELNILSKDLQKLLWKNKVKYPKADAQLKLLGLSGGKNPKYKIGNELEDNPSSVDESNDFGDDLKDILGDDECLPDINNKEDESAIDDSRPPKKTKNPVDDTVCSSEVEIELDETLINHCPATRIEVITELNGREKKLIDFRGKLYLAPLTTVGNLPFRRVCKGLGADITCGEMAMCTNLLQGQASEWALLRRHQSEDIFGVQICGSYPDTVARTAEIIQQECAVDFIDINMGCPIDIVVNKGAGSALLNKPMRMKSIVKAACGATSLPLTLKVRTAFFEGRNRIDSLIAEIGKWGPRALTIHGRSRQQRYSKLADWDYINRCSAKAPSELQVIGNGDIFSYVDWNARKSECPQLSSCMIARGALIKPWIFTEIKEQRHWDISSGERLSILKDYVNFGLQHWGSDDKGVETTRHFLLEWLSYTHRYIPVGLLEVIPQRLNWRAPGYFGRDDLETLMASDSAADWVFFFFIIFFFLADRHEISLQIRISEMLLGKVPAGFSFAPKHKSNAYDKAENG